MNIKVLYHVFKRVSTNVCRVPCRFYSYCCSADCTVLMNYHATNETLSLKSKNGGHNFYPHCKNTVVLIMTMFLQVMTFIFYMEISRIQSMIKL